MKTKAPSSDRERRKSVRLRVRSDVEINPQKYEGRTFYVIKDPVSLRYYRFKEQEHFLIRMMDGKSTLEEAQKAFEKRFRPDRLTLEDLEQFGQQLLKAGLVHNESPLCGQLLFEQKQKRTRQKLTQTFTNILYIKIPIFDPEKLLTKMLPFFRFVFTQWFLFASVLFMLSALMLVGTHFETFRERLPSFHEFFSWKSVIYLWAALGIVKVIHEFGHGLSCKAFGGEVHEMGFLFLCLSPALYCNVSDAWTLPNKWKRIIISFAGIYVELMIAAIATWVWWYTPGQPFVNYLSLSLMVVCSVSTIVFNGNPFMRFDGYYVMADLLEIPNLREKSNRYLSRLMQEKALGIEQQPEPYMALGRRVLFVTYAIIAWFYRWFITFSILYMLSQILGPKLRVLSQMLMLFAAGSMFGWPLVRMIQNLKKRGRLPDMKMLNASITGTLLGCVILGFFFLPLPVSRIRETGVVALEPTAVQKVSVKVDGILEEIWVKEGEWVTQGAVLATFRGPEMESEVAAAETEFIKQSNILQAFLRKKAQGNVALQTSLQQDIFTARTERDKAKSTWEIKKKEVREMLTLRAPCDGYVMNLPKEEELGKLWEKGKSPPFCSVGDPDRLLIKLPITPDDYDILRENLERIEESGEELPVTIRVHGRDAATWEGTVPSLDDLPKQVARNIPLALSTKGGGPLAIKPTAKDEESLEPQIQVYIIPVYFKEPDSAIVPGALGQVKIHCEYRSLAWWTWRTISKTFDLGLL